MRITSVAMNGSSSAMWDFITAGHTCKPSIIATQEVSKKGDEDPITHTYYILPHRDRQLPAILISVLTITSAARNASGRRILRMDESSRVRSNLRTHTTVRERECEGMEVMGINENERGVVNHWLA